MPKAMAGENDRALATDMSLEALFGVKGKVALITGGGSGIGAMIATALARNGATVYIASRKDTSAFAAELPNCISVQADMAKPEDIDRLVKQIETREGRLDILVNNAGTNFSAPIGKYTAQGFDKVMEVNVRSVFMVTQACFPLMKKSASPSDPSRVINIASIQGVSAPTDMDTYGYSASKAAVRMLTQHLAGKISGEGVLVNTISPGPFESRMMRGTLKAGKKVVEGSTSVGRIGAPEDMAAAVLYLVGRGGGFTTGAEIIVDGGATVAPQSKL